MNAQQPVNGSDVFKTWLALTAVVCGLAGFAFPLAWAVAGLAVVMLVIAGSVDS